MPLLPWNASQTVNTTTAGDQESPHVAQLNNGRIVVTWIDRSSGNADIKFQLFDALGNKVGLETLAHGANASDQIRCDVIALSTGGFVISYFDQQGNTILGQRFNADGTINGSPIALSNPSYEEYLIYGQPVLQAMQNGEFAVFYSTSNFVNTSSGFDIVGRVVNAAGVPQAAFSASPVIFNEQFLPATALDVSGGIMIVSVSRNATAGGGNTIDEIVGRYVQSDGTIVSNFLIGSSGFDQFAPSVTALSNGTFLVSWSASNSFSNSIDIQGRIINKLGDTLTPEFRISTSYFSEQGFSKAVALANGKFLVFYQTSANPNESLYAQMFNPDGTPVGAEFIVTNAGKQFYTVPDATTLSDGRVALVWPTDVTVDGSAGSVSMQILDPREGLFTGTANNDTLYGNDGGNDFFSGAGGNDTLWGLNGNDQLYGDAGNDNLYGGRGDDRVFGGIGNDIMEGGSGGDDIYGGAGDDFVSYRSSRNGIHINLLNGEGYAGDALDDNIFEVESIQGSDYNDIMIAGNFAGKFYGLKGDDTITGSNFNDVFVGGLGADTINGLGGTADQASYDGSTANVVINLATNVNTGGDAQGDVITNVERITGSQFGDTITGTIASELFDGLGGNDVLNGGIGGDLLRGGTGSDTFVFTAGQGGTVFGAQDIILDMTKGAVGFGDKIDYTNAALSIGGSDLAATATEASINGITGMATFSLSSGVILSDCLSDIANRMTAAGNAAGEFAIFQVNAQPLHFMYISDGVAGVGPNDMLIQLAGITSIGSIDLTGGDFTILT